MFSVGARGALKAFQQSTTSGFGSSNWNLLQSRWASTTYYLGNLPWRTTSQEVQTLFSKFGGSVKYVKLPVDRATGKPKGFAFVEIEGGAAETEVVNSLNGSEFGGRTIRVQKANPEQQRPNIPRFNNGPKDDQPL